MKDSRFFLDSGAFSAFTKKVNIDINEYISFIKKNKKYINYYAVLDDINCPDQTLINQRIMEKAGLKPLPCFHYGESEKYLKYYIHNYDYICIGGVVPISNTVLIAWLDYIFENYICDKDGYPKVKIHGFGVGSHTLMLRYPWYSVDSTVSVRKAGFGVIIIPSYINGKFDYIKGQHLISISSKEPKVNQFDKHYNNMTESKKKIIEKYVKLLGFNISELQEDHTKRRIFNVRYIQELQKNIPKYPIKFKYISKRSMF